MEREVQLPEAPGAFGANGVVCGGKVKTPCVVSEKVAGRSSLMVRRVGLMVLERATLEGNGKSNMGTRNGFCQNLACVAIGRKSMEGKKVGPKVHIYLTYLGIVHKR